MRSDPSGPTSPASAHARPPSALSSASSSHRRGLSSPRSNQPSYPSSSLSSAAAFDYDDLLGPRRAHGSTTGPSLSPPSSTEDDKRRAEPRLRGLGLGSTPFPPTSTGTAPGPEHDGQGLAQYSERGWSTSDLLGEPTASDSDVDETWLRLKETRLSPQVSSPPEFSQAYSAPRHAQTAASAAQVGSPLSPLVAPFAPSSVSSTSQSGEQRMPPAHPWSSSVSAASLASLAERAREREASWTSSSPGLASNASSQRAFPTLSSPSSFTPSPAVSCSSVMAPTQTYFSARTPVQSSSMFSYGLSMQETPTSAVGTEPYPTRHPSYASTLMPDASPAVESFHSADRHPLSRLGSTQAIPTASGPASTSGADSVSSGAADEVTTVFVVGFPDDVTEREFQNMFTFAEGFEAASLKLPNPAEEEGGQRSAAADEVSPPFSGLPQYILQATRDPFALSREQAGTLSNGSSSGTASAGSAPRKQIIGFARFVSRQHALAAVERLSGRKIDADRSMVLKAEMAKKNLHFKKPAMSGGPAGETSNSASTSTTLGTAAPPSTAPTASPQLQAPGHVPSTPLARPLPVSAAAALEAAAASIAAAATTAASAMGGSGPSIPLSALDAATLAKLANVSNLNPAVLAEIARQSAIAGVSGPPLTGAEHPLEEVRGPPRQPQRHEPPAGPGPRDSFDPFGETVSGPGPTMAHAQSYSGLVGQAAGRQASQVFEANLGDVRRAQPPLLDTSSRSMLQQQQQQQQFQEGREAVPAGPLRGAPPVAFPQSSGGGGVSEHPNMPLSSPPLAYALPRTQNPADMNAPKNTLYVGGLPAVLPSLTGPFSASHLEDSLRNAFSRCPGFKRLQFRSKSNGPIVFVEFVDTAHATRAMQELYGHTLGGLVKGGIRLSYSKNPLGIRANGLPSGKGPLGGLPGGQDGPGPSAYGASSYCVSGVGAGHARAPFDPFDSHRRPPDPIYGDTAYFSQGGPSQVAHSPTATSPGSQPNFGSPRNFAAPGQLSPSATSYGGNFSPFGFDP
ncbi:hypothetical protein JCM8202v2_000182 [Rhodotorula sphaerocarpa]